MGYPMAGYLGANGHEVVVFNRKKAKAEHWCAEHDGSSAATPAEAAAGADIVFTCVGNDDDVREVVTGPGGALQAMSSGTTLEVGIGFLDAPLSGGQVGAETGQLTIMAGGDEAVFGRARPVMDSYAKAITLIGEAGSGQLAKMVNQICIAGVVQGLSEGLDFAMRAGVDPAKVIDAISKGAAQSWQMENRWQTMVDGKFDFGFAVDWMRKDLGITLDEAHRNGATLEMTKLVDQFYAEVQELGGNRWDTSSLIARLRS
jgi:3-hydroxyisobutyrate dehydrogenase-like beta-hydroxyacid dehydrogenase